MKKRMKLVLAILPFFIGKTFAGEPTAFKLPDLSIDAEKASLTLTTDNYVDEISSKTMLLRPVMPPNESLKLNSSITLPGSMKGMGGAPSIRGFPNYTNQVLLDGTPITMPWANWSNIGTFPLRRLQKISLIKGGLSLVFGSSGLAGAINMILPTGSDLEGTNFVQEIGSQGKRHTEVTYGRVAHNNEHLFGYFGDFTNGYQRHSQIDNRTLMYRGSVETDSGWLFKAGILEFSGKRELPDLGDKSMTPQSWPTWNISHRDFVAEKDFGNDKSLILRLYRNAEYSKSIDYTDFTYSLVQDTGTTIMSVLGQEILYNFPFGKKHYLTVGFQRKLDKQSGESVGNQRRKLETRGFFLSDKYELNNRLKMNLIVRHDNHSNSGSENSWAVNTDYKLSNKTSATIGRSRTVRFPAMREFYMTFTGNQKPDGTWTASIPGQGDPSNKAEHSDNLEAHINHKINENWKFSIGRFYSKISNLIDRVYNKAWPNASPRFWWRNLAEVKVSGWESKLEGKINDSFSTWLNYTRLEQADNTRTNQRLNERPEYKLTGGLLYQKGKTSSMLICEHKGSAPYVALFAGKSYFEKITSSTRFDLSFRRQLTDLAAVYLSIENIADEKIEILSHVIGAPPIYDTPRRTTLGIECRF
ncbi:MAG: hypothetical protein Kow0029_11490 [Candidatus Rifleibacteriota bacterium]